MKKNKKTLFAMAIFIAGSAFGQQSEYYQQARNAYLEAARKTQCPLTRGKVLNEYASWNDRMVKVLAGVLTTAGTKPTTPVPPCEGDMTGGAGSGAVLLDTGATTAEMSTTTADLMQFNDVSANMTAAYESALNSGRSDSGAMFDAALAASQSTTDADAGVAALGTGLVLSGIMALLEKKAEKRATREADRLVLLVGQRKIENSMIERKGSLLKSFDDDFFKLDFADNLRKAVLIVVPVNLTADVQDIYFSHPILVESNSDGSFPLIKEVRQNILTPFVESQFDKVAMRNFLIYPFSGEYDLTAVDKTCRKVNFNLVPFTMAYSHVSLGANTEAKMVGEGHLKLSSKQKPSTQQ